MYHKHCVLPCWAPLPGGEGEGSRQHALLLTQLAVALWLLLLLLLLLLPLMLLTPLLMGSSKAVTTYLEHAQGCYVCQWCSAFVAVSSEERLGWVARST